MPTGKTERKVKMPFSAPATPPFSAAVPSEDGPKPQSGGNGVKLRKI